MTVASPTIAPTRTSERARLAPLPVRELPAELLTVDLDVVHPEDEPDTGPSPEFLIRCSAVFAGIVGAALLAGELLTYLV